jgi:uncharacterized protein
VRKAMWISASRLRPPPNPFVLVHIKEEIEGLVHKRVDIIRVRNKMNPFLKERIEKDGRYV